MKLNIILVLMILCLSMLSAQNVFLWDRDDSSEISDPEDPWSYIGLEAGIKTALSANGIIAVVDSMLPDDLTGYDIIFATAGIWCGG
ncbi:MAG: hypothetical protein HOK80_03865 [Candidatus Cloacimonetes bacterium]|jgi:hypothetical protein|nr:hypothetical protein [Candidatus Cloacimonadota bacterium]MBT5420005.1 hypothetical protein [Candidatus Cloacimonadota bacterium]